MGKKMFVLIVVLMSISLIGIIAVQLYWINNAVESKREQFKNDVQKSLARVAERINDKEEQLIRIQVEDLIKNKPSPDNAQIKNFLIQQIDTTNNRKITFGTTILEENFEIPLDFLDDEKVIFTRVTGKRDFSETSFLKSPDDLLNNTDEKRFSFTGRMKNYDNIQFTEYMKQFKNFNPINKRVSNRELNATIKEELQKSNINLNFKYGVYSIDGLATPLKSGYYTVNKKSSYKYKLFSDVNGKAEHFLHVSFPTKNEHILSGISGILLLSLFFIFIIIVAFSSSLYQLIKQKKISEIKTDFINNMTHEFKTPIATINLALDSIKNPKIINDNEKVLRYTNMIRDENKRMHKQVENVLRISKLEKNQLDISKETIDIHDVLEDAMNHISLLVQNREGVVKTHFEAIISEISGNEFHLTNVFVNILENGIKYSEGAPLLNVYTESTNKFFIIKVKDQGIGMSKNVQKHVFDKFYREQKGNVHDVKGHGLGLAYVQEIVEKHHGTVFVESEKGKGSIFTVKLPLI
jgi:two-component system phosphate regulon sensor histidine kinase PhoR